MVLGVAILRTERKHIAYFSWQSVFELHQIDNNVVMQCTLLVN